MRKQTITRQLRKAISAGLCAVMILTGSVFAFADTDTNTNTNAAAYAEPKTEDFVSGVLKDGIYTIGTETDSTGAGRMFNIAQADNNTCKLEVKDGKMTAIVRLNAQGYDKLYLGTAADAAKAALSSCILYEQDADGLYTFRVPFEKFDTVMELAAYGTKGKAWHDHNIVFYLGVPAAPKASFESTSGTVTLKWTKSAEDGISGYEAEYALTEDFADKEQVTVQGATKTSQKFYLEKGNTYYLRIRSIKNVNDGKVYSPWSNTVTCKTTALSKAKLTSAKAAKKAASLKWVKKTGINGYEIQYSTSSKFTASKTKTVKAAKSAVSKKVTGLKSGSKCYFRIRTYKTAADGKVYSAWSAVKSVKAK